MENEQPEKYKNCRQFKNVSAFSVLFYVFWGCLNARGVDATFNCYDTNINQLLDPSKIQKKL